MRRLPFSCCDGCVAGMCRCERDGGFDVALSVGHRQDQQRRQLPRQHPLQARHDIPPYPAPPFVAWWWLVMVVVVVVAVVAVVIVVFVVVMRSHNLSGGLVAR